MSSSSVGNSKFDGTWIFFSHEILRPIEDVHRLQNICDRVVLFDPHGGFGPHVVCAVAMLVHVEAAIVTVVAAASTGVAHLGVAV